MTENLRNVARRYYDAGLNVLPASKAQKRPVGSWKKWTKERPDFDAVFRPGLNFDALCAVCGAVSGGLEIIDFDQKAAKFGEFAALIGDLSRYPVETTQSGGKHLAFRSDACGRNQKLASDPSGNVWIETRGEGGICLIAPSQGYDLVSGDWLNVPTLDASERDRLLNAARSLNEVSLTGTVPKTQKTASTPQNAASSSLTGSESVADYLRGNLQIVRDALTRFGWEFLRAEGDYEYWKRPGQRVADKPGGSFCPSTGNFHCFSSNANPLTVDGNYTPLQLIATLEFHGDLSAASRAYGTFKSRSWTRVECFNPDDVVESEGAKDVPLTTAFKEVEFPRELYECDGAIQKIFELTDAHASRPQPEGAFLGALTTTSYLIGRSCAVRHEALVTFPNLYALFLARSGMGKNVMREVASLVASCYAPGLNTPENFASVQALSNLLQARKKLLWLHDEFGRDLAVMNGERSNANVKNIITETLRLYTSSSKKNYLPSIVAQEAKDERRKNAQKKKMQEKIEPAPAVDYPSLSIFATGNPDEFFDAVSGNLLKNGYLARFTTVVGRNFSRKRSYTYEESLDADALELSERMKTIVSKFREAEAEMENRGAPIYFGYTPDAYRILCEYGDEIEDVLEQTIDQNNGDSEIKLRASEKLWKYSLLFAASVQGIGEHSKITADAARLAVALSRYELKLFETNRDSYDGNRITKLAREILAWARTKPNGIFLHCDFTRKLGRAGAGDERLRREVLGILKEGCYIEDLNYIDTDKGKRAAYRVVE